MRLNVKSYIALLRGASVAEDTFVLHESWSSGAVTSHAVLVAQLRQALQGAVVDLNRVFIAFVQIQRRDFGNCGFIYNSIGRN